MFPLVINVWRKKAKTEQPDRWRNGFHCNGPKENIESGCCTWEGKGHIHMLAFSVCSNKVFSQVAYHNKTLLSNTFAFCNIVSDSLSYNPISLLFSYSLPLLLC